jgi:hypothetical protein
MMVLILLLLGQFLSRWLGLLILQDWIPFGTIVGSVVIIVKIDLIVVVYSI